MTEPATNTARERESSPTVGWYELFYDLVVVAAVSVTNDAYLAHPSMTTALSAAFGMTALCWIWFLTTLANNTFPADDVRRRLLLLVQMGAIVTAALSVDQMQGLTNSVGLLAYAIALLIVAALLVWGGRASGHHTQSRTIWALMAGAAICLVGAVGAEGNAAPFILAAVLVTVIPILTLQYHSWHSGLVLRLDHLRERLGLFVLIVLGEGFAQLVQALHSLGSIPRSGAFALVFLVSFSLWWIYFDGTFSRGTDLAHVRWRLSLLAHLTLVIGMTGTLDILVLLTAQEEEALGDNVLVYFAACLATVLLSFTLLGFATRGRINLAGWLQIASSALIIGLTVILYPGDEPPIYPVISAAAVLVIANALFAVWADRAGHQGRWRDSFGPAMRGVDPDEPVAG